MKSTVAQHISNCKFNRLPISDLTDEQQEELYDWVYNAYQLVQGIATVGKYADREKVIQLATGLV